jgi:carboxymethylenebutenolidase
MADNPHQNTTFASNGGEAHGYLATPPSGSGPGLIVIQEWWGLVDHIKDVTDRFAAEGFVVLAPDLYGGRTTHDADEAGTLMQELPVPKAAKDLAGAVDFLLGHDAVTSESVGAVGFCMGGGFVIVMAAQQGDRVSAAVPYYGVGGYEDMDLSGTRAAVLGHFGSDDPMATPEKVAELEAKLREDAGIEPDLRVHEGAGHAFFNDENPLGTYDAELARSTWQDTVAFLHEHVR